MAKLDGKIAKLQELLGALVAYQTEPEQKKTAGQILDQAKVDKSSDPNLLKKEVEEIRIERDALKEHRDSIVKDYTLYKEMKVEQDLRQEKEKSQNRSL